MMADSKTSVGGMSFEAALSELEMIVKNLETGKTSLEESIGAYERGVALKNHCESKLTEAKSRIEKIVVRPDGNISTVPLDPDK